MAKKKKNRARAQAQDFSNNPFKNLKGLSALETRNQAPGEGLKEQHDTAPIPADDEGQRDVFADEMAFLGVRPLEDQCRDRAEHVTEVDDPLSAAGSAKVLDDAAVFLDAVGSMEKVFKDEWSEDVPEKRAAPRRMRQVERGQLVPEDELDLHGLSVDEARSKALFFLQNAVFQGLPTVLLITGKGLHSADGPVLRSAMEKFLNEQNELVVEWGVAPRRYGGAGALVIFLRQPEPDDN